MKRDIHEFNKRLEDVKKLINSPNHFFKEDKKDLLNFYHFLLAKGLNSGRIIKYFYHLKTLAKLLNKPFKLANKQDIIELISKVERNKEWTDWTKRDFKIVLKKYIQFIKGHSGNDYPEEVSWIKTWLKNKVTKRPDDILTEEEILKLVEAAENIRDKAFILALYESGFRIGEFLPLKIKHLEFDGDGCVIRIISEKSGNVRVVRLIASAPLLAQWLELHPFKNNLEAYVWIGNSNPKKHLAYQVILRKLKKLAKKAKIKKSVNPHSFRHARATHLSKFLSEALLRQYFGWSPSSDMATFYIHLTAEDLDETIKKLHGIKARSFEKPKITVKICSRCKEKNEISASFCKRCGTPLDEKVWSKIDKLEETLIEFLKIIGKILPEARKKFEEIAKKNGIWDLVSKKK